ncbi:MAG: AAA family ATPase [bacterium]
MEKHYQAQISQAMGRPDFYPHPVAAVIEQRETHISRVFLTGPYAYKMKKPVNLGFLDFSTLASRHYFCCQEVNLNRRLSHNVYLKVVAITREGERFSLNGPGEPVEYAVKMRQLPWERSLFHLMTKGLITGADLEELALTLAGFYSQSPTGRYIKSFGSWERIWGNCEENFRQTEAFAGEILDESMFHLIRQATRSFMERRRELFEYRQETGKIRDCHGDLRSGHIYFLDGLQIIDCLEFNDRFRYSDICSDLAFLAMDLDYEGQSQAAHAFLESYARYSKDSELFVLLDFYKCYRAYVRVKVNCIRLQEGGFRGDEERRIREKISRYVFLAFQYAIQCIRPALLVVCGLPGSGKTTIAGRLSRAFRIKVYHSDVIRKALFGLRPNQPMDTAYGKGMYSEEASRLTYGRLLLLAQEEIKKNSSVILDATYGSRHNRQEVLRLAGDMDVNLLFIECQGPDQVLKKRLEKREAEYSISDARIRHFEQIKAHFEPLHEVDDELYISIETDLPLQETMCHLHSLVYRLSARQTGSLLQRLNFSIP